MKYLIVILTGILIQCSALYAGTIYLKEHNIFSIKPDKNKDETIDKRAINKICELKRTDNVKGFPGIPFIREKFIFNDLPGLTYYTLSVGDMYSFLVNHDYDAFLFNSYDSSICLSGGDSKGFNRVIGKYLPSIIEKDEVLKLIELYLNTNSQINPVYIIKSKEDLEGIWNSYINEFPFEELRCEIKSKCDEQLRRINDKHILYIDSKEINDINYGFYYSIKLYAWDWITGSITYWRFKISKTVFELEGQNILEKEMGPYRDYDR